MIAVARRGCHRNCLSSICRETEPTLCKTSNKSQIFRAPCGGFEQTGLFIGLGRPACVSTSAASTKAAAEAALRARQHGRLEDARRLAAVGKRPSRRVTTAPSADDCETKIPLPDIPGELLCALKHFETEVGKPDGEIDLARAAALLALHAQPDMDSTEAILRPLARLGEAFQSHAESVMTACSTDDSRHLPLLADELCSFLANEGFQGSPEQDYHDAAHHRIDKVLETRSGIPLTLSLVYMEVGRAAGLQLQALNFPGTFLLCFGKGSRTGLLDAFKNRTVNEKEAGELMGAALGMPIEIDSSWRMMRRMPKTIFLQRMVKNLQTFYERSGDFSQASLMAMYASRIEAVAEGVQPLAH